MEIKIGVQHINREVVIETEESAQAVEKSLAEAISSSGLFTVSDAKGRKVVVPGAAIGYVEFGVENARRVGFGAV